MPIYQYKCNSCGLETEKLKSISKSEEVEWCSLCENMPMIKQITAGMFRINGSETTIGYK